MNIPSISGKMDRPGAAALPVMLGEGLGWLRQVAAGWWYTLFPDKQVERLASERASVCGPCPHNTGSKCGLCGCPLQAKMRSPSASCPDGRWER